MLETEDGQVLELEDGAPIVLEETQEPQPKASGFARASGLVR
jgi:hypothetical protein